MKTLFVSALTTLAAATALLNAPIASADASCKPSLVQKESSFPLGAQLRGQEGTVYMNVTIDANGRAQSAPDPVGRKLGVRHFRLRAQGPARDAVVAVEYHNRTY